MDLFAGISFRASPSIHIREVDQCASFFLTYWEISVEMIGWPARFSCVLGLFPNDNNYLNFLMFG